MPTPYEVYRQSLMDYLAAAPSYGSQAQGSAEEQRAASGGGGGVAGTAGSLGGLAAGRYAGRWGYDQLFGEKPPVRWNPSPAGGGAPVASSELQNGAWNADAMAASSSQAGGIPQGQGPAPSGQAPNSSGTNWGSYAQGGIGLAQLYQAHTAAEDGNYLGAGIYGGAGTANVATAAGYGGTALGGGATVAGAATALGGAAGAYGLYETGEYASDAPAGGRRNATSAASGAASGAALGASVGSIVPGVGTAVGAVAGGVLGALYGLGSSYFGSSKDKYQMMRDDIRDFDKEKGILDKEYRGTLADGSKYDFGKDGKGFGNQGTGERNIDYKDPVTGKVIGLGNVIAAGTGLYGRTTDAGSMMWTKAALSNAGGDYEKARSNMVHFALQRGFNPENLIAQIDKTAADGNFSPDQAAAYRSGVNELFRGVSLQQALEQPGRSQTKSPGIAKDGSRFTAYGPPRSSTRSPGIKKNGRKIDYGRSQSRSK